MSTSSDFLCKCKKQRIWVTDGRVTSPCPLCGRRYKGVYKEAQMSIVGEEIKNPIRILKKDIVIPAGTVFETAPTLTRRVGGDHYVVDIGFTPDSTGSLSVCVDFNDDPMLKEYFDQ